MPDPKRHHYLPEFYLEGFTSDGTFSVFDREAGVYRQQTPKNTAVQSYYYSVVDSEGAKHHEIENYLSSVESRAKPTLDRLVRGDAIDASEKDSFALFVALMMYRTPDFQASADEVDKVLLHMVMDVALANEERARTLIGQVEAYTGEKLQVTPAELVDFNRRREFAIDVHRNASLDLMVHVAPRIGSLLAQMEWDVFHAPSTTVFLTTDNPVAILPPNGHRPHEGVALVADGVRKYFPLSRDACLVIFDHGEAVLHHEVGRPLVRKINIVLASQSRRFVMSPSEAMLRRVVEQTRLSEWEQPNRFRIG